MLKHNQQVLQKERKTAIGLLSNIETVLSIDSEPKPAQNLLLSPSKPPLPAASPVRAPPKMFQPTIPTSGRKTAPDLPIPPHYVTPKPASSLELLSPPPINSSSLLESFTLPSPPSCSPPPPVPSPSPSPSSFLSISSFQHSSFPIGNSIPFSAQPSFAEEDSENDDFGDEEESQKENKSEGEEAEGESNRDGMSPEREQCQDDKAVEQTPKLPETKKPQASVISRIWGMNPAEGEEVSDGEWDD
jgi:hypothetical protein